MLTRLPPGPSGSTIAGILLLGLIARKSGAICSPLVMFTGITLYGSAISSSATLILRPFGVFQVCSSIICHTPRKCCEVCSIVHAGGKYAGFVPRTQRSAPLLQRRGALQSRSRNGRRCLVRSRFSEAALRK